MVLRPKPHYREVVPVVSVPKAQSTVVKAGHGHAFALKAGQSFRIIDIHGRQIVDLTAWILNSDGTIQKNHHFSTDVTRMNLKGATPTTGSSLYTNTGAWLFFIKNDTVNVHDLTFPACYPELYEDMGEPEHRSCSANIAEAMRPWGIDSHLEVPGPFNCFQNTPNYVMDGRLMTSRPGDYIEMEALMDCVVAVSSCPFDKCGFGSPTDIGVVIMDE